MAYASFAAFAAANVAFLCFRLFWVAGLEGMFAVVVAVVQGFASERACVSARGAHCVAGPEIGCENLLSMGGAIEFSSGWKRLPPGGKKMAPPQAPLVDVSKATPPAESGAGEDEMSPTTGARLKMRSRGRARMLRQAVELIDPVTMERIDAERDALLKKALLSQGVELQQLLPRLKEDFSDAHATPEIVQARFKGFERMRTELLDLVLETRRQLQSQAEARRRAKAKLEEETTGSLGMESPEELLQREQEHMQRVLAAAHARIEKEKAMEKEHELRAQEMIKESVAFHEGLVVKKEKHEKQIEQKRYKTELSRQARNAKRAEQDDADLSEARRLADVRAEKTMTFEETNSQNKLEATNKALEFARGRAVKLQRVKKLNEEKESALLAVSQPLPWHARVCPLAALPPLTFPSRVAQYRTKHRAAQAGFTIAAIPTYIF
jgi:hypothetical protein